MSFILICELTSCLFCIPGSFTPNYKLTIGVDFALKVLYWDEMTKINLQLW